ncbi:uncharacterized protein DUF4397 [Micromonospora pisi]|uniref:Uncharacterized protein DUF4397 n=1 Tax=Micromonospora pisi TaxID=589240 RepID=A0A495JFV9_9ACTN|nr:DUF4397 domain-containing protein [Micromonospora pisi]RKR87252.1 uncharacterized protein DUF4397 [Micromonospora pisi]
MHIPQPFARALRRLLALSSAALLGAGPGLVTAAPAGAAGVGYVRLAHLSPDTPAVDVYLGAATGSAEPRVFPAVGYGVVSGYLSLPVGRYAVAMRQAGAPASAPPVLTTEVAVTAGNAYTVAGVGRYADLGLRVLDDDLSAPDSGWSKVRVVQASVRAPVIDIAAAAGPTIANGVQFATTTPYTQVRPGSWKLSLNSTGGAPTTSDVSLAAGTVYSLLVLDGKQGGLTTELRVDAKGGSVVPAGGVDAGAGGARAAVAGQDPGRRVDTMDATEPTDRAYPFIAATAVGGVLLALLAAATVLLLRRRARRTW